MSRNRVWYTDGNVLLPDTSTTQRASMSVMWVFKEVLKGTVTGTNGPEGPCPNSGLWVVTGSSDSVTAAFDGVDRTGTGTFDNTKWVRGAAHTNAHTWVCLRNATSTQFILISWVGASDAIMSIYCANTAFSGGGTTSRPTSTTEWPAVCVGYSGTPTDSLQISDGAAVPYRLHMAKDANGEFYMIVSKNSSGIVQTAFGYVSRLHRPVSDLGIYTTIHQFNTAGVWVSPSNAPSSLQGQAGMGRSIGNSAQERHFYMLFTLCAIGGTALYPASWTAPDADGNIYLMEFQIRDQNNYAFRGILPDLHLCTTVAAGSAAPIGTLERITVGSISLPISVAPLL